ncbi:MAG: DUF1080 domain-containing protein [Verrucomicrobia bacterium]|jgi:hypothetical protein|nr:DUF1080 domain-containing protein [Verrucomicrobiota bacterium]
MKKINQIIHACVLAAIFSLSVACNAQTVSGKPSSIVPDKDGWISLFDGKSLSGWMTFDPHAWSINDDGLLVGKGSRSHLFSPNTYRNMEFKAEVRLNHKGNSGMYFRAKLGSGWPKGYETQVENTSSDPQRTGSLYNFVKIGEQLIEDDTWWTQHVIAIGNRVIIKVNNKVVVDFVDEKNTWTEGHLAVQQHDPGSVVHYRNVVVRPLPDDADAAKKIASKGTVSLKE